MFTGGKCFKNDQRSVYVYVVTSLRLFFGFIVTNIEDLHTEDTWTIHAHTWVRVEDKLVTAAESSNIFWFVLTMFTTLRLTCCHQNQHSYFHPRLLFFLQAFISSFLPVTWEHKTNQEHHSASRSIVSLLKQLNIFIVENFPTHKYLKRIKSLNFSVYLISFYFHNLHTLQKNKQTKNPKPNQLSRLC